MIHPLPRNARALLAAACLGLPARSHAQVTPSPAAPQDPIGALAEAPSWRRWPGAPLRFSVPPVEPRFDVVVTTAISRAWLQAHDNPRAVARGCTGLDIVARDTAAGGSFVDWESAEGSPTGEVAARDLNDAVVITIAPIAAANSPCRGYPARTAGAIAAGVAFQRFGFHDPGGDLTHASLLVNGEPRPPLRVERARQRVIVPRGAVPAPTTQSIVRIFLPPEHFAVDSLGRINSIQVAVAGPEGGTGRIFTIPFAVRRQVHQDLLAGTIARAADFPRAPTLALPPAKDAELRRAIEVERSGDLRAAALLYHARLYDPTLGASDAREARVRLALALAALGDSSGARGIADQVMGREPCFTLAPSLPAGARALFAAPPVSERRCTHNVPGVLARSILLPGLGQYSTERQRAGIALAVASGLAFAYAAERHVTSERRYERYLAADNAYDAENRYARAAGTRSQVRRGVVAGASLWAAGAIEATVTELGHRSNLQATRGYGGLRVVAAPRDGGVAVMIRLR